MSRRLHASSTRFELSRAVSSLADWSTAQAACASTIGPDLFTHLIIFDDDAERDSVATAVGVFPFWIGLVDRVTEGSFLWVTAQPSSYPPANGSPWGAAQPDDFGPGGQDCVRVVDGAELDDAFCPDTFGFVCECDGFADDPARHAP